MIAVRNMSAKQKNTKKVARAKRMIMGRSLEMTRAALISRRSMAEGAAVQGSCHWISSWIACFITVTFLMSLITLVPPLLLGYTKLAVAYPDGTKKSRQQFSPKPGCSKSRLTTAMIDALKKCPTML